VSPHHCFLQKRGFQPLLALLPIGHHLAEQFEKPRIVVTVFDVT
jgi:hypothetical protein